jgi:hypothetical protein
MRCRKGGGAGVVSEWWMRVWVGAGFWGGV